MVNVSQKILNIMKESNGTISIETLTGNPHTFTLSEDETYIYSDTALGNQKFGLNCFDMVIELLQANGGKAPKGNGRGRENKVGRGKCTVDTICGYIATNYYGHEENNPHLILYLQYVRYWNMQVYVIINEAPLN